MGWHATCGVTQLPIHEDDPVALILLTYVAGQYQQNHSGHSNPSDIWSPRALPIFGRYNGVGGIEGWRDDWNTRFIIDGFQQDVVERDDVHMPIWRATITIKHLLNLIRESRVRVTAAVLSEDGRSMQIEQPIGHMMVHRFAYDGLTETVEEGRRRQRPLNLRGAIHDGKVFYSMIRADTDRFNAIRRRMVESRNVFQFLIGRGVIIDSYDSNRGIAHYRDLLEGFADGGRKVTDPEVLTVITEMARFVMFNMNFTLLRKSYMPQAGQGLQTNGFKVMETTHKLAAAHIKRCRAAMRVG